MSYYETHLKIDKQREIAQLGDVTLVTEGLRERIRDGRLQNIQLFRQRLSKKSMKAYATIPKGSLGNTQ